ncbi:hypothetical protein QE152_g5264 [Popillia japonica]|uniref:Uncharacterized protein n=1 Tax=Popillia japonica TaxID=7064 RepID=A0AAW1MPE6_POPJA
MLVLFENIKTSIFSGQIDKIIDSLFTGIQEEPGEGGKRKEGLWEGYRRTPKRKIEPGEGGKRKEGLWEGYRRTPKRKIEKIFAISSGQTSDSQTLWFNDIAKFWFYYF